MRHLYLLRHAHAISGAPDASDHQRSLSARGEAECAALAQWIAANSSVSTPDVVLCSPATRTRETLGKLSEALPAWPLATYPERLYLATAGDLLLHLQKTPPECQHLWIIGHQPGLQDVALMLAAREESKTRELLELGLITAGLIKLEIPTAWSEVAEGVARLTFYSLAARQAA